jgi:hypothetical protein
VFTERAVPFPAVRLQFVGKPLVSTMKHFQIASLECTNIRFQIIEDVLPINDQI